MPTKPYTRSLSANKHRVEWVNTQNGKLVFAGEWCSRRIDARRTYDNFMKDVVWAEPAAIEYVTGRKKYTANSGPKKKK